MRLSIQHLRSPSRVQQRLAYAKRIPNAVQAPVLSRQSSSYPSPWPQRLSDEARSRLSALSLEPSQLYPRITSKNEQISCSDFASRFCEWPPTTEIKQQEAFAVNGRLSSIRSSGTRLIFIDIADQSGRVQGVCNFRQLPNVEPKLFRNFFRSLRRGDLLRLFGTPYRTKSGQLSLLLSKLPEILSPCWHPLPTDLENQETRIRNRHVDFLVNPRSRDLIAAKSSIVQFIRQFFLNDGQLEVQTPILAEQAGGAVARPFQTSATSSPDRKLSLRIAPELWLKRMIVGGFDRIFEIGASFRNEGIDLIHNPEFTTCEFYRAYTNLDGLIHLTEQLVEGLINHVRHQLLTRMPHLNLPDADFGQPFRRLDFILEIEKAIHIKLPILSEPDAQEKLSAILASLGIQVRSSTMPQMLDKLCSTYLEPQCTKPTFIVNHPECMSPLSKSFEHPSLNGQRVAARAEFYISGHEIANMYEEENSPIEQRRKFVQQARSNLGNDQDSQPLDEQYLEALEWGLPPVGGWGCGIERLCMALTGVTRIGDFLSFGTLQNVIARRERS